MNGHLSPAEISGFVDGEAELDGKGKEHLSSCSRCSALLEEQRKLRRMARAVRPEVPSDRMWAVIKDGISREPAPRRPIWSFLWARPGRLAAGTLGTIAVAALVLIVSRQVVEAPRSAVPVVKAPAAVEEDAGHESVPMDRAKSVPAPAGQRKATPRKGISRPAGSKKAERRAAGKSAPVAVSRPAPEAVAPAVIPQEEAALSPAKGKERGYVWTGTGLNMTRGASWTFTITGAVGLVCSAADRRAPVKTGAASRFSFKGKRFVLEADKLDYLGDGEGIVKASGRVVVCPANPGLAYFAMVDGFSRTLTGAQDAVSAEILQPGERLFLRTR